MADNKNQLAIIYAGLDKDLDKQAAALPKHFNKQRFMQNCMTVLQENDFSKCEARSVVLIKNVMQSLTVERCSSKQITKEKLNFAKSIRLIQSRISMRRLYAREMCLKKRL